MVNMKVSNQKLKKRAITMVCEITELCATDAEALLVAHNWDVRSACVTYFKTEKER